MRKRGRKTAGALLAVCLGIHMASTMIVSAAGANSNISTTIDHTEPKSVSKSDSVASGSRLSYIDQDLYINKTTTIKVTLKDRKELEQLIVSKVDSDLLSVRFGKWTKDQVRVVLTPKKSGTATATLSTADKKESIKLRIHITMRQEMDAGSLYQDASKAMVELMSVDAGEQMILGSGFFISGNRILTNYHVIEYANELNITDYQGTAYKAKSIAYDTTADIAIITVEETAEHALVLSRAKVLTGETVYALGSPLGFTGTISEGMVSRANRYMDGICYHQNTAYTSKSSGGGPLINSYGEVIGIQTRVLTSGQDINFALTLDYLDSEGLQTPVTAEEFYKSNEGKMKPIEIIIELSE